MRIASLFLFLILCGAAMRVDADATVPPLIPLPAELSYGSGHLRMDDGTPIVLQPDDAASRATAGYLSSLLRRTRGLSPRILASAPGVAAITLVRDPHAAVVNAEGYTLDVDAHGVRIVSRDDAGLFHGVITLWQLMTPDAQHGAIQVPALHIRDQPRFVWRGLMLDSARHFQSVAEIERLLDQMAQHKLNVFHWHLTDDQGWRIQIRRYPELTRIGAWRTPPDAGHDSEPSRYGGFYTQKQIRQIVAYASVRHITVVPEIDMPGHAQANVWTEHMPTMKHVEHAVFPRLDALSEVDWSPAASRDWTGFLSRLSAQFARYQAQGVGYADSAFAPDIKLDRNAALANGTAQVTLSNQAGHGELHYTLDGRVPDQHAPIYQVPFKVKLPVTVRAATFASDGSVLAAPRQRVLDRASLLSVGGNEMPNCPGSDFRLRVQPMPDATSLAPVYSINVFNACQLYPGTSMDGVVRIHVDAVRLERNYALAHDAKLVVSRPHSTPFGELVVHQDQCTGLVLATLPLPDPAHSAHRFTLDAAIPAQQGEHALCLIYTAPIDGPLYALDRVALLLGTTKP